MLHVRDRDQKDVGFVETAEAGQALELRATGVALLFRLDREPDGDLRLEDGSGQLLAKLERRDDGYQVVDAQDQARASVKARPGKTSLRDAANQTRLSTRDPVPVEAMACFARNEVPLAFQGGCALAVLRGNFGG